MITETEEQLLYVTIDGLEDISKLASLTFSSAIEILEGPQSDAMKVDQLLNLIKTAKLIGKGIADTTVNKARLVDSATVDEILDAI